MAEPHLFSQVRRTSENDTGNSTCLLKLEMLAPWDLSSYETPKDIGRAREEAVVGIRYSRGSCFLKTSCNLSEEVWMTSAKNLYKRMWPYNQKLLTGVSSETLVALNTRQLVSGICQTPKQGFALVKPRNKEKQCSAFKVSDVRKNKVRFCSSFINYWYSCIINNSNKY